MNYTQVLARLAGRVSRKVGQHTYLRLYGNTAALMFHGRVIIDWQQNGRIVLDSHGNRSATTRRRFNQWLPKPYRVNQCIVDSKAQWELERVKDRDTQGRQQPKYNRWLFLDGMTIQTND